MTAEMRVESTEEYLKRGGVIETLDAYEESSTINVEKLVQTLLCMDNQEWRDIGNLRRSLFPKKKD